MTARQLRFTGDGSVEVESTTVPTPGPTEVRVETDFSAISAGTERLFLEGDVPVGAALDPTIDALDTAIDYPLRYGYAAVGRVVEVGAAVDDAWLDREVFAFEPHASGFTTDVERVHPVPYGIATAEATLFPTVETAVNFLLDGAPRLGERVAVVGQGMVGLTTTALLAHVPIESLLAVEPNGTRRRTAELLGADRCVHPADLSAEHDSTSDLVFEISGDPSAMDEAVALAGFDGRIIVGSWYGTAADGVRLGTDFHRGRLTIESSHVSTLDPSDQGRWTVERRRALAWSWLDRLDLEGLVTHTVPMDAAERAYRLLGAEDTDAIVVLLSYR